MPKQLYSGGAKVKKSGTKEQPQEAEKPEAREAMEEAPVEIEQPGSEQHTEQPGGGGTQGQEVVDTIVPSRAVAQAELPLDAIVPSRAQAREPGSLVAEALEGLVASMREHGILSRIRVRQVVGDDEHFELVFGERRWRAARLAGFTHYPVEIAQYSDDELEEVGLIENIQRQDLTPLEEARKYQRLLALQDEQGQPRYSIRRLAARIGKDKSYIEMRLAVLRAPEDVQQLVRDQPAVPLRTAFEIGKVEDPEKREEILSDLREGTITGVEEVKSRVREATGRPRVSVLPPPAQASIAAPVKSSDQEMGESESVQASSSAQTEVPALLAAAEQSEREATPTITAKSSLEAINLSLDSTQALVLFEQQLQEDNAAIMGILHRLGVDTGALTAAQREVLILYIDRWGKALMDVKSHAHARESKSE